MKLKFKHQKFQADAAKAVVDVFNGQPYQSGMSYLIDKGYTKSLSVLKMQKSFLMTTEF